jgi:hypothetical protein
MKLRTQFDDVTLPRIQLYDWGKSFEKGRTEAENMESYVQRLLGQSVRLIQVSVRTRNKEPSTYIKSMRDKPS